MKPHGLRERKSESVKRAFFDAAMDLFREKGFDGTSVDEIAERAGFSRATFFNHFGSKPGVLRYYGHRLQARVERLVAQADASEAPLELVRRILFAMAEEAEANREDLKLVHLYSLPDPDYQKGPTAARQRVWDILTNLLEQAQRSRQIRRDIPARELALHILSLHMSTVLVIVAGHGSASPTLHSVWQFILGGVRGEHKMVE